MEKRWEIGSMHREGRKKEEDLLVSEIFDPWSQAYALVFS